MDDEWLRCKSTYLLNERLTSRDHCGNLSPQIVQVTQLSIPLRSANGYSREILNVQFLKHHAYINLIARLDGGSLVKQLQLKGHPS